MSTSYTQFNYELRPAKSVQRRMLCEAARYFLHKTDTKTKDTTYIGFGSIYYTDIILFHRELNINKIKSIEKNTADMARFQFNKPFGCIELIFDDFHNIVSDLDLDTTTIIWLDYDGPFSNKVLESISTLAQNVSHPTFLSITANTDIRGDGEEKIKKIQKQTSLRYHNFHINKLFKANSSYVGLTHNNIHTFYGDIVTEVLNQKLADPFDANQHFSFIHQDNAKMSTYCYFLTESNTPPPPYDFIKPNGHKINVPKLTQKEIRKLNELYDGNDMTEKIKSSKINYLESQLDKYLKIRRYYPVFTQVLNSN